MGRYPPDVDLFWPIWGYAASQRAAVTKSPSLGSISHQRTAGEGRKIFKYDRRELCWDV